MDKINSNSTQLVEPIKKLKRRDELLSSLRNAHQLKQITPDHTSSLINMLKHIQSTRIPHAHLNKELCDFIANSFYAIWSAEAIKSQQVAEDIMNVVFVVLELCVEEIMTMRTDLVQIIIDVLNPRHVILVALQENKPRF